MAITIDDYVDVAQQAQDLGSSLPPGLALLPRDFEKLTPGADFLFDGQATTLEKILRGRGVEVARLEAPGTGTAFIHNKSHDWVVPVMFIGSELLKSDPNLVSACIDIVKDHILERFKGINPKIKASIVVERTHSKSSTRITYEGDAAGLGQLAKVIRELPDD
ncbi:MAG: hypothetical protein JWR80_10142 [Bradyrhizobium sp.]|nr:hypothetical protein [Bradyrhizobium sp.]